jgi:maltodextrin utilization protein YvdJ
MKTTKQNVIDQVQNSVSSIFTKEDVLAIINSITEEKSRVVSVVDITRAIDRVVENFEMNAKDVVDCDNAEFGISYNNQLQLDNIDLNSDYVREALENAFMDFGEDVTEE